MAVSHRFCRLAQTSTTTPHYLQATLSATKPLIFRKRGHVNPLPWAHSQGMKALELTQSCLTLFVQVPRRMHQLYDAISKLVLSTDMYQNYYCNYNLVRTTCQVQF